MALKERINAANAEAFRRIVAADPILVDVAPASEVIPGMRDRLILHSGPDTLRRSVAKRATLLNLGSFFGNSIAYQMSMRAGYGALAVLLGLLYLPLALGLAAAPAPVTGKPAEVRDSGGFRTLCRNRGLRRSGSIEVKS